MDCEDILNIPDLIVRKRPVDDCSQCALVYINRLIGHRNICRCRCHSLTEETQECLNTRNSLQGPDRIGTPTSQAAAYAPKPSAPEFNHDGDAIPVRTSAGLMDLAESTSKASVDVVDHVGVDGGSRSNG
jgi:hypothetical protein